MNKVCLGNAVKLHGYLGEIKIVSNFDKDFDIKQIKTMFDEGGNEFVVKRILKNTDGIYVGFEGVDLEKAKTFIGKQFYIDRNLVGEKILIEDIKKSNVFLDDGTLLGKVFDVQDYGSAEVVYVLLKNGKELLFPCVKGIIVSFDWKENKLVINKDKLKEVSDYED
jgi:ribosomal 30S subunit maturation factor RimM